MYDRIIKDASFFTQLLQIDKKIASEVKRRGCPCGGPLDVAHYRRKPRGLPDGLDDEIFIRFSYCCRFEGCRKRVMPPSVRFAGRKVWLFCIVLLASSLPSRKLIKQLGNQLGLSQRIVKRWQSWWRGFFIDSSFWRIESSRFLPPLEHEELPRTLLERFRANQTSLKQSVISCLQFLSPGV